MKLNYEVLLETCDQDLKAGNGKRVATHLEELNLAQVPRKWRRPLARICRRAGLANLGLKLLTPIAHASKVSDTDPTPEELVEYAALLNLSGATQDAIQLLSSPKVAHIPEANLFRAFCCFSRWESAEAIPYLQKYLSYELEPYARLVGRVNLASAYVAVRHSESGPMLDELIAFLKEQKSSRLEANCLEMRAQVYIQQAQYEAAQSCLRRAAELLGKDSTFDRLFILKWMSISEALSTGRTESLQSFKAEALTHQEWEGVREADLYLQKISFDPQGFDHLYFGTPSRGYRERIQAVLKRVPDKESFCYGPSDAPRLDVVTSEIQGWSAKLSAGKKPHQLIEILLRDLYKPMSKVGLFEELFPGEHFDVFSSLGRVHQIILRTRKWIASNKLPLEIVEDQGRYQLKTLAPFSFLLPLERREVNWYHTQFERLAKIYSSNREFSASEASKELGLSSSSFLRLTKWGLENNRIQKTGKGIYTRYAVLLRT